MQTPVLRFLQVGPAPRACAAARIMFAGSGALVPGDPLPNVCIHGHTHVPEIVVGKETRPTDLLLCPGSPTNPPRGIPAMRGEDRRVGRPYSARLGRADHARPALRRGRAASRLHVGPAEFSSSGLCGESAWARSTRVHERDGGRTIRPTPVAHPRGVRDGVG